VFVNDLGNNRSNRRTGRNRQIEMDAHIGRHHNQPPSCLGQSSFRSPSNEPLKVIKHSDRIQAFLLQLGTSELELGETDDGDPDRNHRFPFRMTICIIAALLLLSGLPIIAGLRDPRAHP